MYNEHIPYARVAAWAIWGPTAESAPHWALTDAQWGADAVAHHAATEWVTIRGRKVKVARDCAGRRGLVALMRPGHRELHAAAA